MATEPVSDVTVYGDPLKHKNRDKWYESTVAEIIRGNLLPRVSGKIALNRIKGGKGEVEIFPRLLHPDKKGMNAEGNFKIIRRNGKETYDFETFVVWYDPDQWSVQHPSARLSIPSDLRAFDPGHLRDEVLFHELVHAGRRLDGLRQKEQKLTTGSAAAYEDMEEFCTILVTNIYISEKGGKVFRASHGVHKFPLILDQTQSSSDGFLKAKENYDLVEQFCKTDAYARQLADIDTPFNPVRAYFLKNPPPPNPLGDSSIWKHSKF